MWASCEFEQDKWRKRISSDIAAEIALHNDPVLDRRLADVQREYAVETSKCRELAGGTESYEVLRYAECLGSSSGNLMGDSEGVLWSKTPKDTSQQ